jgi:hypothetical protein
MTLTPGTPRGSGATKMERLETPKETIGGQEAIWAPQAGSQVSFLSCPVFEVLYEGTRGPGKTDALIMDFLQHVGQGFGAEWRGILFRKTYPELADIVNKCNRWIPLMVKGAKFNKSDYTWTFPDGEQLLLRHARIEQDYWAYHGHAYPWIAWEELTNWADDKLYRKMMSCCRSTNKHIPRKYRATCNPYGVGHNWVKRRFKIPHMRGVPQTECVDADGNPEPMRVCIHGSIRENRILLDADPEYITRLRASARNKAELMAWLYGSWSIVAGGMFDDVWESSRQVLEPFPIPRNWRVDRSFDWGSSKPFSVGWWAESDGSDIVWPDGRTRSTIRGDLFRIAEWYGCSPKESNVGLHMDAKSVADGIKIRERNMIEEGLIPVKVRPGPADSAIDASDNGPSVRSDMLSRGVDWEMADKAPGSRKQGWLVMRRMLRASAGLDNEGKQITGPREEPGLYFFRSCEAAIELLPSMSRDDKDLDDIDTHGEDHVADEARYRVRNKVRITKQRSF